MSETYNSLSHSKWDCKYHLIFVPKMKKKMLYGQIRPRLGQIFHALASRKDCRILQGHLMPDHAHMLIEIPSKQQVSAVVDFMKGKVPSLLPESLAARPGTSTVSISGPEAMRSVRLALKSK
jgi:putative transposase